MRFFTKLVRHGALLLAFLCSACVSLERGYPDKRYFVIEVREDAKRASTEGQQILLMANLRISPRYADRSFVYRISEAGFESDFYNQFLSSPATMISEEVRKGLAASPLFKFVLGPSSPLSTHYVLEGSVNALYGDFRNLNQTAAFLEIEFFLHNEDPANSGIVLQKRYTKSVALSEKSPEALVKGWSQALEGIVAMLISDLGNGKL